MCRLWGPCRIVIFIYLLIQHPGYARRPVVTVTPNYNKIPRGEKIMMTCDEESDASECSWYHENISIYTGKDYVISVAEIRHSGDYQCQNNAGERSEIVTLNITTGRVVLQAPVYIYEGDDVSLRCYSSYPAIQTIFYKNNQTIQTNDSDLLPIKSTDLTSIYRCSKQVPTTFYRTYSSDDTSIDYADTEDGDSVIFTPEYNKLLTGENITMKVNGGFGVTYYWHKDNERVAEGRSYTITSAQVGHSGNYNCRTRSRQSATFRLDVSDGSVILQAPPLVYRGSDMVLRCHSRPQYRVINTTFYKDDKVIQTSTNLTTVTIPWNQQVGRYKCKRTLSWEEYVTYTDEVSLHIRELFAKPKISIVQNPVREGDNIICNTSLSLPENRTLLQFTFYRDGEVVLNLNSSSIHPVVLNVRLEDSGNYSCEVRTANTIRKRSEELYIQIQELFRKPDLTAIRNPVTKGDNLTLICNTSLSPLRQSTELHFAFYRDEQNVQGFSLFNQYEALSTQLKDSGNYSCEVRTPTNNVTKRSEELSIQIKEYKHNNTATLVTITVIIILLIIIIIIIIIVNKNRCKSLMTSTSKRQTADTQETESHRDLPGEGDVCYADIKMNRKAPVTHTTSNEEFYVNITTSKTASSPKAVETVIYSEIKPRKEI